MVAQEAAVTDEAGHELPGGVSALVLCSRCTDVTSEQADALVARMRAGYRTVEVRM